MSTNHRALDESDIALIECIKLTPSLYDPRNADFRFAHRKDQDWEAVAKKLGLTAKDAKRRWTCLRDRYSRELKILRLHPERNGYGKNDFFRIMDFLRCFVRKRRERRRNTIKSEDICWDRGSTDDASNKTNNQTTLTAELIQMQEKNNSEINNDNTRYTESSDESNKSEAAEESVDYNEYMQNHESYNTHTIMETENANEIDIDVKSNNIQNPKGAVPVINTACSIKPTPINASVSVLQAIPVPMQQQRTVESDMTVQEHKQTNSTYSNVYETTTNTTVNHIDTEDDYFCKSVAAYLSQLSRRHKIKAKVEMFQILEKYIEIEENEINI